MASELVKAEYESLRKEIADTLTEMRTLERWVVVSVGGIISWLFSNESAPPAAWWIPFIIVVLAGVRESALYRAVAILGGYLHGQEEKLKDELGWEHYRQPRSAGIAASFYVVWGILVLVTLGLAVWQMMKC